MTEIEHTRIDVAGIVISVSIDRDSGDIHRIESYNRFQSKKEPDIAIRARFGGIPELPLTEDNLIFDSGGPWSLYRIDGRYALALGAEIGGEAPYRVALFDEEAEVVELASNDERMEEDGRLPDPLVYPLGEVLLIHLLGAGRGLMVHSCGIDDGGRGFLFAGNSGDGKSTTAGIWKDRARILNDDRIIIREHGGRFRMFGTPWHGDFPGVSPEGVPVERIFLLRHGEANKIRKVDAVTSATMIISRCFPPLWDAARMKFTLDFIAHLTEAVPFYELDFIPDENIVEFVRCVN